jgi:hypothetical protein
VSLFKISLKNNFKMTDNNNKQGFARNPDLTPDRGNGNEEETEELWEFLGFEGLEGKVIISATRYEKPSQN